LRAGQRVAKQSGQPGFADLYKKGHFLLEAKQSYLKEGQSEPVRSEGNSYDQLMRGGRAFEVYFDWAGNARGFEPFPERKAIGSRSISSQMKTFARGSRASGPILTAYA
jgi:hypothetical protein